MRTKHKGIVDARGNPVGKREDSLEDLNLPPGVHALVETRIEHAIDSLREHNRDDLQDLTRNHTKRWRHIAFISWGTSAVMAILGIVTWFIAPQQITAWIANQVDKKLTEPMIQESADRVIDAKMAVYVDTKLEPVNQQAEALIQRVQRTEKDIAAKQAELANNQVELAEQLRIRKLAIAAKAGSRVAFNELHSLKGDSDAPEDLLSASRKEVELFYDTDHNQLSYIVLVQTETRKDPGFSTDEIVFNLMEGSPSLKEAAINSLGRAKSKAAVKVLCKELKQTENLRVAARTTWALQKITGEEFRPLAFDHVIEWWAQQTNEVYCGDYSGYSLVRREMWVPPLSTERVREFTTQLTPTIESDPSALHARCLKAGFLVLLGQDDEAKALFDDVRAKRSDYRWLNVWEAAAHLKTNDIATAESLINKAFAKSPSKDVEQIVRMWKIFNPIEGSTNINWPSKETTNAQPKN